MRICTYCCRHNRKALHAVTHVLDNPIWHALTGPHAGFAETCGRARRYPPDIATFAAIADTDPAAWADIATLLGRGGRAALFRADSPVLPPGLPVQRQRDIDQMLGPADIAPPPAPPAGLTRLGAADMPDMLDLVRRTEPGPLQPNVLRLGTYLGIRDPGGRLLAMAGERIAPAGYVEISAVCTDPAARGRGLARDLCHRLIHAAHMRGLRTFLHVKTENGARRVYERLGFTLRTPIRLIVMQVPG